MAKAVAFHPHISGQVFSLFLSPQEIALTFGETKAKFSLCRSICRVFIYIVSSNPRKK